MSIITFEDALDQLNVEQVDSPAELELFVAAANEWITDRVSDTSPSYIKVAALFLVDHLWDSQRGPASTPASRLSREEISVAGVGYAVPNRVLELIGPKRLVTQPRGSFPDAVAHPDSVEYL